MDLAAFTATVSPVNSSVAAETGGACPPKTKPAV
jgi:hypothetical protein